MVSQYSYKLQTKIMEYQVNMVKKCLEGWSTVLLSLQPVLMWEQQWHPMLIVGGVSIFYLTLYYLDLNTLNTFAVLGIFFNMLDFTVPFIIKSIYGSNYWTGQMEKKFENICNSLVVYYNEGMSRINKFFEMRTKQPLIYYIISCSTLLFLVWLSSAVNNTFLFYILTMAMLLWPGLRNTRVFSYFETKSVKVE